MTDEVLSLDRLIYQAIRDINRKDDSWDRDAVHASDLSVALESPADRKCSRALWNRIHGVKGKGSGPGELLMMRHGSRIHEDMEELIQMSMPEGWTVVGREIAIRIHGVTGRLDYLLAGPDGVRVVVDIKTVRGGWFRYAVTSRPADERQVQTYMAKLDADYGILLYVDREGQNGIRQYEVHRDDAAIEEAAKYAHLIAESESPPEVMPPVVKVKERKGPDAVYVELPWQCRYCNWLDSPCPGAIPEDERMSGVVGHVLSDGKFQPGIEDMSDTMIAMIETQLAGGNDV